MNAGDSVRRSVVLLRLDERTIQEIRSRPAAFERRSNVGIGEVSGVLFEVVAQTAAMLERMPRAAPWGAYLAVDDSSRQVIGTCGFPAAPAADGTVEIAYFTFPGFEGRGYATVMAGALAAMAEAALAKVRVIAHTLPERSASTRVLEKNGFRNAGEIEHAEDGRVWRWEKVAMR
jgi:ribosomal-protein-alanine N-acetyltransferase